MKKLLAGFLVLCVIFCAVGCSGATSTTTNKKSSDSFSSENKTSDYEPTTSEPTNDNTTSNVTTNDKDTSNATANTHTYSVEEIRKIFIDTVKKGVYDAEAETPNYRIKIGEIIFDEKSGFYTTLVYTPSTDSLHIKVLMGGNGYYEETTMPLFISSNGVYQKSGEIGISHKEISMTGSFVATANLNEATYKSGDYIECRWHNDNGGDIYKEQRKKDFSDSITSNVETALKHFDTWLNGSYTMSDMGFEMY